MSRAKIPPADVLFSGRPRPAADEPERPEHIKISVYMRPQQVAELDALRAEQRRRFGTSVDRSQLLRAALRVAQAHEDLWVETLEYE